MGILEKTFRPDYSKFKNERKRKLPVY